MKASSSRSVRPSVVVVASGGRRRLIRRPPPPSIPPSLPPSLPPSRPRCPFCGFDAPSRAHLASCAPDALNPRGWASVDAVESAAVRASVLNRHGRRSRAYEVCSARFGWDEDAGGTTGLPRSARETRDAWRGKRRRGGGGDDDAVIKLIVDIVRREVRATPLSVSDPVTSASRLEILRDDDDATFVNKPARAPCTPTSRLSGDASVTAMVLAWWGEEAAKRATTEKAKEIAKSLARTPYAAHRLDLETSGVFVLCKTAAAAKRAQRAFESGTTTKVYLAVCRISSEESSSSILSSSSEESSSSWTLIDRRLVKEQRRDGSSGPSFRVRAVLGSDSSDDDDGKSARTDARVLARTRTHALVQARPRTGRTHQIRAHLASIGLPIVRDALYGDDEEEDDEDETTISRHALHAHALKFPFLDDVVVADPPGDFLACLRELGLSALIIGDSSDDGSSVGDDDSSVSAFLRRASLEAARDDDAT